jgi:glycosyltransferase involved in cell wall biosynthesis
MASGLPVIATIVGGNPELVDRENNGMLFSLQAIGELAGFIQRYQTDHVYG